MLNYLDKFTALLVQLTDDERDEVVEFYREYLLDANIQEYDDCVAELGTPKQLARKVLADYSIRLNENLTAETSKKKRSQTSVRTIWLVVLALLSTPITIPALLVVLFALFSLAIIVVSILLTLGALVIGLTLLALALITASIGVFSQSIWVACFYLGVGLAIIGGELLIAPLVIWLLGLIIQGISILTQRLYHRFVKKNRAERGGRHHAQKR
ncbi:DUF1700 domain-containing protein [Lactiplantibacillus modestisalitolerans]|uniref:DUF1700 domain-containing protein n=1 Tax=Lactiplantibacillus modestisalitolerans TaxID=1457219 RepID=A0ABV5WSX0_9LACO|nr:DUF1700 domain-containing protein [Lactiplantibacillus modestisalitolerans]